MRSRYKVWVYLILISLALNVVSNIVSGFFKESTQIDLAVDTSNNFDIEGKISGVDKAGVKLKTTYKNDETSVVISDKYTHLNGYSKYEDVISTPIVLFAPLKASDRDISTGFATVDSSNYIRQVDMYSVLVGLEQDKTWQEIGISDKVVEGKIRLVIPRENNPYYSYVVESIYSVLLQGINGITVDDIDGLKDRVRNILSKADKVDNLLLPIEQSKNNYNERLDYLVLGPECIITDNRDLFYTGSSHNWMPIYFRNTSQVSFDVYIKESLDKKTLEDLEYLLLTSKYVNGRIGYRSSLRNFNISDSYDAFSRALETVQVNNLSTNVKVYINEWVQEEIRTNGVTIGVVTPKVVEEIKETPVEEVIDENIEITSEVETNESSTEETLVEETLAEEAVNKLIEANEIASEQSETTEKSLVEDIKDEVENKEVSEEATSDEEVSNEDDGAGSFLLFMLLVLVGMFFIFALLSLIFY